MFWHACMTLSKKCQQVNSRVVGRRVVHECTNIVDGSTMSQKKIQVIGKKKIYIYIWKSTSWRDKKNEITWNIYKNIKQRNRNIYSQRIICVMFFSAQLSAGCDIHGMSLQNTILILCPRIFFVEFLSASP